jgi:hypothetical protein
LGGKQVKEICKNPLHLRNSCSIKSLWTHFNAFNLKQSKVQFAAQSLKFGRLPNKLRFCRTLAALSSDIVVKKQ